jgi:hypothetical protein
VEWKKYNYEFEGIEKHLERITEKLSLMLYVHFLVLPLKTLKKA